MDKHENCASVQQLLGSDEGNLYALSPLMMSATKLGADMHMLQRFQVLLMCNESNTDHASGEMVLKRATAAGLLLPPEEKSEETKQLESALDNFLDLGTPEGQLPAVKSPEELQRLGERFGGEVVSAMNSATVNSEVEPWPEDFKVMPIYGHLAASSWADGETITPRDSANEMVFSACYEALAILVGTLDAGEYDMAQFVCNRENTIMGKLHEITSTMNPEQQGLFVDALVPYVSHLTWNALNTFADLTQEYNFDWAMAATDWSNYE